MKQTYGYQQKARQFFAVLLPIFITQLSLMATGFFNTIMAGHISQQDLAGVAVGVNLFLPFFGSVLGIISGLTPTISQLYGGGRQDKIGFIVKQGFYWAMALAFLFIAVGWLAVPRVLPLLNLEPKVHYITAHYLLAVSFGIVPIFLAGVLRNFIDAHGHTRLTMCITMTSVPVNIALNYVFMYGLFGVPAFGGIGAGIGSAIAFSLNLLLNVWVVTHIEPFKSYRIFHHFPRPQFSEWKKQLGVGIPIGSTMFCEQSIFGAVGLFMTVYGTVVVAAHQAAMNFTTIVYMVPLAVSMTLTILVGYEVGAKRFADAEQYIRLSRVLTMVFVGVLALLLTQFKTEIAALYTSSREVQPILTGFLVYAVFMQVSDSINAPLQGALRGYKDVHVTFLLAVLSFWVIGLPGGWMLANWTAVGPYGYWIGLVAGVLVGAVCLQIRMGQVQRKFSGQEG
ncbi:MATE family efflux transporter [Selenomonas ruminis]|uniref:Probable multidrug resistance protein NorM n=1 Tax=Selenomonas ruminis TaxID=2593411 RepID=A0A5D6W574_9FIRM|nr:MATE family efflux transporter [Selenomonas sp. mPRGC5]TYZ23403.1 MATE family efflux transporter [Selenomonas sp. mPRGC5]